MLEKSGEVPGCVCRLPDGVCSHYGIRCTKIPKTWSECRDQLKEKTR